LASTLQNVDLKELISMLERYLKAGRISFSLLDYSRNNEAITNELIVKYDQENILLYIKNTDGEIKPVGTETDLIFNEFLAKFLEVGESEITPPYDPKLFFQIKQDSSAFYGYSQENINFFYNWIESNMDSLEPYLLHANTVDEVQHDLIPMQTAKTVYYDLGKVVTGQTIRDMDSVISALVTMMNNIKSDLTAALNSAKATYNSMIDTLNKTNSTQTTAINGLKTDITNLNTGLSTLNTNLTNLANKVDQRIRPKTFTVGGNANTAYPVRIYYNSGVNPVTGGYEFFQGQFFLSFEDGNRSCVAALGDATETNSSSYWNGVCNRYVVTQKGNGAGVPAFYHFTEVGPMNWICVLRGAATYTVWSKYIDYVSVDASTTSKNGVNAGGIPGTVWNYLLYNDGNYNATFVKTYAPNIATDGLGLNGRYVLHVV